jgi:hypothetical protein
MTVQFEAKRLEPTLRETECTWAYCQGWNHGFLGISKIDGIKAAKDAQGRKLVGAPRQNYFAAWKKGQATKAKLMNNDK